MMPGPVRLPMSAAPSTSTGSEIPWDAVVVGAGANGSVAAMVLAEAGLRVLVLEAGPDLSARRALGGEPLNSLRRLAHLSSGRQRLQRHHPGFWKHNPELFVDERQSPYSTPADAPFLWTRGRQVGGKSLTWGGITLRLSEAEFLAARRDGHGPAWPIGSRELAPFYDRLETLLGVHGQRDGLPQLPDGRYLPPLPFTPGEKHLQAAIGRELGLPLIHSRGFRLHRPTPAAPWPPSSAQGSCLARALATGRVQLRSGAVVSHLEMDAARRRAEAVVVVDAASGRRQRLAAPLVVLCASTIETVRLLLHSSEAVRGGGLSDPSGSLGRCLMDHISTSRFFSIPGIAAPPEPAELSGAGSCFIPNTVNLDEGSSEAFLRGYGIWAALQRFDPPALLRRRPGEAVGFLIGHGEVLARAENRVSLDGSRTDAWDLPIPHIDCRWGTNEAAMVDHMQARMAAVVAAAGGRIRPIEELFVLPVLEPLVRNSLAVRPEPPPPGYYIHELGGARMAARPEEGVVDPWNRCWGAQNVLVTDGACWPSAGWQSPTLTEMAITWRACAAAAAGMRRH
jgi:choline dehydrogenase-like flavoprotein